MSERTMKLRMTGYCVEFAPNGGCTLEAQYRGDEYGRRSEMVGAYGSRDEAERAARALNRNDTLTVTTSEVDF